MSLPLWEWAQVQTIISTLSIPEGYTLSQATMKDIQQIIRLLLEWYPDILTGAESCHLNENFYAENACLADSSTRTKSIFPIVVKFADEPVGFMTLEKSDGARTINSRMGVVSQKHRGAGLAYLGPMILEATGRNMDAGLVYYMATLKLPHQQIAAERTGFQLVGILPAFDLDTVRPGVVRRVYEAIYAKVLVDKEQIECPPETSLTPKTLALWKFLFGGSR